MKIRHSTIIATVVALGAAAVPSTGSQAAEVVAVLSGRAAIRAKITRALKQEGIRVVAGKEVAMALRRERPPVSDEDWARIATKLHVDALVSAGASRSASRSQIEVVIRSGIDGSITGRETVSSRGRPRQIGATLVAALSREMSPASGQAPIVQATPSPTEQAGVLPGGLPPPDAPAPRKLSEASALESGSSPPGRDAILAPEEKSVASTGAREPAAMTRRSGEDAMSSAVPISLSRAREDGAAGRLEGAVGKLSTFDIEADARTLRRTFDYQGGGGGRRYLLTFNPVAGGRASFYPVRNAGVFAAGEFGAGLETGSYPTGTRELMGGAVVRLPLSFGQLGASAAYFHHAFLVQDTTSPADASRLTLSIPNTVYGGVRVGANARFALGRRVQVVVDGAYRLVTAVGDGLGQVRSAGYFPASSSPYGVDGRAYVGVGLGSMFEARAGVDYRRYVYGGLQGTTASGTTINASGAVDQYVAFSLGLAAVLGPKP